MAIDLSGQGRSVKAGAVVIDIKENHPLIQLANVLPWRTLLDPVVEDLKSTTQKGFWHIGRKIKVRTCQKQADRDQKRSLQKTAQICEATNATGGRFLRIFKPAPNRQATLEHPACFRAD